MIDIDFLPADYQQFRRRRQKTIWRRGVFLVLLGLVMLGGLKQRHTRLRLEQTRDEQRAQAARMLAQLESVESLQSRLEKLDARRELLKRLQLRIAPTRLLADVAGSLPEFVTLTELRIGQERLPSPASQEPAARAEASDPTASAPVVRDLKRLRASAAATATFVSLHGLAPDDVAISTCLARLHEAGSFDEVQLLFTDRHEYRGHSLRCFALRLRVRPLTPPPPETSAHRPLDVASFEGASR